MPKSSLKLVETSLFLLQTILRIEKKRNVKGFGAMIDNI